MKKILSKSKESQESDNEIIDSISLSWAPLDDWGGERMSPGIEDFIATPEEEVVDLRERLKMSAKEYSDLWDDAASLKAQLAESQRWVEEKNKGLWDTLTENGKLKARIAELEQQLELESSKYITLQQRYEEYIGGPEDDVKLLREQMRRNDANRV